MILANPPICATCGLPEEWCPHDAPRPAATRADVAPLRAAAFAAERAANDAAMRAATDPAYEALAEISRDHADLAWDLLWATIDGTA